MDIWLNGIKTETNVKLVEQNIYAAQYMVLIFKLFSQVQFVDGGNLISFTLKDGSTAAIQSLSSGNKKQGMLYQLAVNDQTIQVRDGSNSG